MRGGHQEEGIAAAEAAAVNDRFMPIKDVKAMLQTGRLEEQKIAYRTKKDKLNLLYGVIHKTSYFCSCGYCDHNGKALSARTFEQNALNNSNETHNQNEHILFCSSNISLFEACRRLKKVTNEAILEAEFDIILKGDHEVVPKRMEITEKRMENLESHVETIEKKIDLFCKEMVRYQELFLDLSKIMGKFVDDM